MDNFDILNNISNYVTLVYLMDPLDGVNHASTWWCESCSKCGWEVDLWFKLGKILAVDSWLIEFNSCLLWWRSILWYLQRSILCSEVCQPKNKTEVCSEVVLYHYFYIYTQDIFIVVTNKYSWTAKNTIYIYIYIITHIYDHFCTV